MSQSGLNIFGATWCRLHQVQTVPKTAQCSFCGVLKWKYHKHYIALHCVTLHYIALHITSRTYYITSHHITSHYMFTPSRNLSSRGHPIRLEIPLSKCKTRDHFFACRVWNSLPASVVSTPTANSFKILILDSHPQNWPFKICYFPLFNI